MTKYIKEVQGHTAKLGEELNNINKSIAFISAGSQDQANQAQQVMEAADKLTTTAAESLQNSVDAAKASDITSQMAIEGEKTIESVFSGIKFLNDRMGMLNEQTAKIGDFLNVITNIADQTNLLSLNAAIEAARAGEHGRGFAVVAEEVRKLAATSAQSTREISTLVATIQESTVDVVAAANEGTGLSTRAGEAFEKIVSLINKNVEMIKSIETASREQALKAKQVAERIGSIAAVTQEATASAQETAASVQEVANLADKLREVVNVFKVH